MLLILECLNDYDRLWAPLDTLFEYLSASFWGYECAISRVIHVFLIYSVFWLYIVETDIMEAIMDNYRSTTLLHFVNW